MVRIIPTVLAKNVKDYKKILKSSEKQFPLIQLDIMDNKFVKNKSISLATVKNVKIKAKKELHLMIKNPEKKLKEIISIKPYSVIIHYSSTKKLDFIIKELKKKEIKVGIGLNPNIPIKVLKPYLNKVNFFLLMTVVPGFYGSKFEPKVLKKIKSLRKLTNKPIEVDGHINNITAPKVIKSGATILCSGSYLLKNTKNIKLLKDSIKNIKRWKKLVILKN